jgi:Rubisco LSMT substrate-binding
MLLPVSEENEAAVCQSMIDGCREALRLYGSSIDEDLRLLRNSEKAAPGSREELAITVRILSMAVK